MSKLERPAIERFVEAVERRREPVTLAAGGGREIVIERLAPCVIGGHAQRANPPLQADLEGVVLAPPVVVSEEHAAELREAAQIVLGDTRGRILAEVVHVHGIGCRTHLARGEHARTDRGNRGRGRAENGNDRIAEAAPRPGWSGCLQSG